MKVCITGATGHIGANTVRAVLAAGHSVRALVRSERHPSIDGLGIETRAGDVLNPASLLSAFEGCDAVIHLAAAISIQGDRDGRVHETNVVGTANVAEAVRKVGVGQLIHASSVHAMDLAKAKDLVDETTPLIARHGFAYDRSKADGERIISEALANGSNGTILRPFGVIGPHDYHGARTGKLLSDLACGRMPVIVSGGYNWVDVRDVADAISACLGKGPLRPVYLLPGHWASLSEIGRMVDAWLGRKRYRPIMPRHLAALAAPAFAFAARLAGHEPVFTHESVAAIGANCRNCSHHAAQQDLGFQPRPLSHTIADTMEWLKAQGMLT